VNDPEQERTATLPLSEVRFRFAPGSNGLLGYASVRLGDHLLNDIALVRAADGNVICVYPRRFSASGHPHYVHQPISRQMADALQEAIVGRLRGLLDGSQPVKEEETT
jgi:DNA-binding cell septation regulator SpoVG